MMNIRLTKSIKNLRSICLIASSRKPEAPVVCVDGAVEYSAPEPRDRTYVENPSTPTEEVIPDLRMAMVYLVEVISMSGLTTHGPDYTNIAAHEIIVIAKLSVHVARPSFMTWTHKSIYSI